MKPSVSIITAAYNAEDTLPGMIGSVLTQDYPGPVELVIVDDGSQDRTRAIAEHFATLWAPGSRIGIRVLAQDNRGQAAARNRAIEAASGEYLAIVDADDILLPAYLSRAIEMLVEHGRPRALVTCNAVVLNPAGVAGGRTFFRDPHPGPERVREAMLRANVCSIFSVFPRALVRDIGVFDEGLRACEDWDLWLRAAFGGWEILRQEEPQALYRWTGESVSSNGERVYAAETEVMNRALERFGDEMSEREAAIARARIEMGPPSQRLGRFEQLLRAGRLRDAGREIRGAAKLLRGQRAVQAKALVSRVPGGTLALRWHLAKRDAKTGFRAGMER